MKDSITAVLAGCIGSFWVREFRPLVSENTIRKLAVGALLVVRG
jgi:hypothetical protein